MPLAVVAHRAGRPDELARAGAVARQRFDHARERLRIGGAMLAQRVPILGLDAQLRGTLGVLVHAGIRT